MPHEAIAGSNVTRRPMRSRGGPDGSASSWASPHVGMKRRARGYSATGWDCYTSGLKAAAAAVLKLPNQFRMVFSVGVIAAAAQDR